MAELADEGLVVGAGASSGSTPRLVAIAQDATPQAFDAPRLERYTDMQDLVLLDPVHQVDDTGWPRTKEDAESDASLPQTAS